MLRMLRNVLPLERAAAHTVCKHTGTLHKYLQCVLFVTVILLFQQSLYFLRSFIQPKVFVCSAFKCFPLVIDDFSLVYFS